MEILEIEILKKNIKVKLHAAVQWKNPTCSFPLINIEELHLPDDSEFQIYLTQKKIRGLLNHPDVLTIIQDLKLVDIINNEFNHRENKDIKYHDFYQKAALKLVLGIYMNLDITNVQILKKITIENEVSSIVNCGFKDSADNFYIITEEKEDSLNA